MIQDYDGNIYTSVIIGEQEWMVENLKTTHYKDGISIGEGDGYWWYNNDINYKDWGAFYNWYAISYETLAPEGWRIPTEEDWQILINNLGENSTYKMKLTGDTYWQTFIISGTTSSPSGNTIQGQVVKNENGTFTYSIPAGMENYSWSVTGRTKTLPSIVSGGGNSENFIELSVYTPNPWRVFVDYTGSTNGSTMWYNKTIENSESTNESGFSAVPNGYHRFCGTDCYHGQNAYWWCAVPSTKKTKYIILPSNNYGDADCVDCGQNAILPTSANFDFAPSHYQTYGFSVRCIKS
jgi:uncharacterized protein (TIGR02145 family)